MGCTSSALVVSVFALVVSTLAPQSGHAQGVTGTVRYQATGEVLPGVFISVLEPGGERVRGVLTDDAGRFTIQVPLGRYLLRAERIGLRTETLAAFDINTLDLHEYAIEMDSRPVEIAGLVVDSRVQSCRLRQGEAARIQRWWTEIRTALGVSAALQRERFGRFLVTRFEREWDADLSAVIAENRRFSVSTSTRPFEAAPAEELVERGFVQGDFGPDRQYFGPDADVLLSSAFLAQHCFSLVDERERSDHLGLHFEPVEGRAVSDIEGTLWVDTTTAELRDLDFSYVNFVGPEGDDAGGKIVFQYLPSGAWIVSDWSIRMPRTGVRGRSLRLTTLGYHQGGGSVMPLSPPEPGGEVGSLRGVVVDSLHGGALAGAVVAVLGTTRQTVADGDGRFWFFDLPAGRHYLSFSHDDLEAWGLTPAYLTVDVLAGGSSDVELFVPSFQQAALALCLGDGVDAETVVVGRVLGADREPLPGRPMQLVFERRTNGGGQLVRLSMRTDQRGRFVTCRAPADEVLTVRMRVAGEWADMADFIPGQRTLTYREVRVR